MADPEIPEAATRAAAKVLARYYKAAWPDDPVKPPLAPFVDEARAVLAAALRTVPPTCPSCQHVAAMHQDDGCWYTVTDGRPGRDLVCPCEVARTALDGRDG